MRDGTDYIVGHEEFSVIGKKIADLVRSKMVT